MHHPAIWQNEILTERRESETAKIEVCSEMTDRQLAELVVAGEESAFEHIFDRYTRLVTGFQNTISISRIIHKY